MRIPFIGGAYEGISKNANAQTCINLYVEPDKSDPDGTILVGTPGRQVTVMDPARNTSFPDITGFWLFYSISLTAANKATNPSADVASIEAVNHGLVVGQQFDSVNGVPTAYNVTGGTVASVIDKDNFTYAISGSPGTASTQPRFDLDEYPYLAEIRGTIKVAGNFEFFVVGNRGFYRTSNSSTSKPVLEIPTKRLNTISGPVALDSIGISGDEVIVSDALTANNDNLVATTWFWDLATDPDVLTEKTIKSFTVTEMDGYIIRDDRSDAGRFVYSTLYDASVENTFAYATTDGDPDDLVGVCASRRELWLFGVETTEVWYNSGDANNPFARFQGGFNHVGCAAPLTIRKFDNSIFWLGQTSDGGRVVYMASDKFVPVAVSPPMINHQLNSYAKVFDAFAFTLIWEGHPWYVMTFPTEDVTWVYDGVSKNWHKWQSGASGAYHANIAFLYYSTYFWSTGNDRADYGNKYMVGDSEPTGNVYELLGTLFEDNGAIIYRERTAPHLGTEENRSSIASIQLDIEPGQATRTSQGSSTLSGAEATGQTVFAVASTTGLAVGDNVEFAITNGGTYVGTCTAFTADTDITCASQPTPGAAASGATITWYTPYTASMEWSKDGGQNFGNRLQRSMGVSGESKLRLMWYKLGRARNWVFRFKTHVNSKVVIKGLLAKFQGEPQ